MHGTPWSIPRDFWIHLLFGVAEATLFLNDDCSQIFDRSMAQWNLKKEAAAAMTCHVLADLT